MCVDLFCDMSTRQCSSVGRSVSRPSPEVGGLLCIGFTEEGPDSAAAMEHAYKWILKWGGGLAFVLIIAWPCLALPAKVFSKGYFTFWVILSIIWGLVSPPETPPLEL